MAKNELSLEIDDQRLDKEWLKQPSLYHEFAQNAANARLLLEQAKADFDVVKADLYFDIAANPDKYGLAKTTEAAIQSKMVQCESFQDAQDSVNEKARSLGLAQALVSACDQRKQALENLVRLQLADYYSAPKADKADKEAVEEMEKGFSRRRGIRKKTE